MRLALPALAAIAAVLGAAPAASADVDCLRAQTPPAPPAGGAVFARALEPGSSPNVVVIPAGSKWTANGSCAAAQPVMNQPSSIVVGARAAVLLKDAKANLLSAWGARDVRLGESAPSLFPGRSDWTTTEAAVVDPGYLLNVFNSCRSCSLRRVNFTPVQGYFPDRVAYMQHLNGADLSDATLTGDFSSWNLSDASLSGATLSNTSLAGAFLDHTRVDGADFDGADLRGTQLTALRYDEPPTFTGVRVGPFGASCTTFRATDLVAAKLTLARADGGCEAKPLAPDSSVALRLLSQVADGLHAQRRVSFAGTRFVATAADRGALAGDDLSGVNLTGASFVGFPARFVKTKFDGALLAGASFELADLSGASFRDVSAAGASFRGADLADQGDVGGANFSGSKTDLRNADFVGADVSDARFVGAGVSGAVFSRALAVDTDFTGVRAENAGFNGAHIYGNGRAFDAATNLRGADFNGAVLAGDVDQSGGFDFTHTDLTGAKFDGAQCIGCNFAAARLEQVSFTGAYLPGARFAGVVSLRGANLLDARLYCGERSNDSCARVGGSEARWAWPLDLGEGEGYGPVPFADTDLAGVSLNDVAVCPDGKSGSAAPAGCAGHLQPDHAPPIPARCSAAGTGACPSAMSTVFDADAVGTPLALVRATPPTWATTLTTRGVLVAFDDGTVRLVDDRGAPEIVATRLGKPSALAVGLDGSLYVADPALHRVQRIDPSGRIETVAASLEGPYGVWVDPVGVIYIADGPRGIRKVRRDGTLLSVGAGDFDVRSVVGVPSGDLYAATNNPDHIVKLDLESGRTTKVVGTGKSGYNGNATRLGTLAPGTSVQIDNPRGLAIGLDGDVLFADTGNNLIRAYVPSSGHVVDALAGVVSNGAPREGFNGDGHWADQTELSNPRAVSPGRNGLFAIADSGNQRVRQFGPSPIRVSGTGTRR